MGSGSLHRVCCLGVHDEGNKGRCRSDAAGGARRDPARTGGDRARGHRKKKVDVQTVYETDIIRDGHKWEVNIREDGTILSTLQEEAVERDPARSNAGSSAVTWRDRFDVNKTDLLPTGTNAYITMQAGRVLKLKHGTDTLTVTILPDTQEVDGVAAGIVEERETKNGQLIEVSRNFMATDKNTGDVCYFGEVLSGDHVSKVRHSIDPEPRDPGSVVACADRSGPLISGRHVLGDATGICPVQCPFGPTGRR